MQYIFQLLLLTTFLTLAACKSKQNAGAEQTTTTQAEQEIAEPTATKAKSNNTKPTVVEVPTKPIDEDMEAELRTKELEKKLNHVQEQPEEEPDMEDTGGGQ